LEVDSYTGEDRLDVDARGHSRAANEERGTHENLLSRFSAHVHHIIIIEPTSHHHLHAEKTNNSSIIIETCTKTIKTTAHD
jgi:hypothetical protein